MGWRYSYLVQSKTFYACQKGLPNKPFFVDEACYSYYLNRLLNSLRAYRLQLHTYVLLPHEIHLLISPHTPGGLNHLLEKVAAEYGEYFVNRYGVRCPLLASKPGLHRVETGDRILKYQRFIELVPVREHLVRMPGEYPWSGYRINAFGGHSDPIVMHQQYRAYCFESRFPYQRYRDFVAATSSTDNFRPVP